MYHRDICVKVGAPEAESPKKAEAPFAVGDRVRWKDPVTTRTLQGTVLEVTPHHGYLNIRVDKTNAIKNYLDPKRVPITKLDGGGAGDEQPAMAAQAAAPLAVGDVVSFKTYDSSPHTLVGRVVALGADGTNIDICRNDGVVERYIKSSLCQRVAGGARADAPEGKSDGDNGAGGASGGGSVGADRAVEFREFERVKYKEGGRWCKASVEKVFGRQVILQRDDGSRTDLLSFSEVRKTNEWLPGDVVMYSRIASSQQRRVSVTVVAVPGGGAGVDKFGNPFYDVRIVDTGELVRKVGYYNLE